MLFVPGLVLLLGLDQHQAEATSLLAIVPVAIVGTYTQDRYGNVRRADALLLGRAVAGGRRRRAWRSRTRCRARAARCVRGSAGDRGGAARAQGAARTAEPACRARTPAQAQHDALRAAVSLSNRARSPSDGLDSGEQMGLDNPLHIAFLVVILLLVFGARRLPEIGRSLGSGMREFKQSVTGETQAAEKPAQQPTLAAAQPQRRPLSRPSHSRPPAVAQPAAPAAQAPPHPAQPAAPVGTPAPAERGPGRAPAAVLARTAAMAAQPERLSGG